MTSRLSIDVYAAALALVASARSEDPHCKVGAVALDSDNRVIAMGYNGLKTKFDLPKAIWEDRDARLPYIIHAEQNLLSLVKRGEVKTLAVTLAPCSHCAKSIVAHNINRVIYLNEYERDPSGLNILRQYGVELIYIPQEQVKTALLDFWSQTL